MTLTSMIIPTYNGLDLIRPCIDAIRQYSGDPASYEIIVVDNGSTDGTAEYCALERIRFVRFPDNRGFRQRVTLDFVQLAGMSCCC